MTISRAFIKGGGFPSARPARVTASGPIDELPSSITVATVNSTSWIPFKKWWLSQEVLPHITALQEHKLRAQEDIDEASSFLVKQGFASYWETATVGPKGQAVGGAAVIVSAKLGSKPCSIPTPPGRLAACKVQLRQESEIVVVSAYLHSGKGLKQPNLELLGNIAALQRQENRYLIAAGDWQNNASAISRSGWTTRAGLTTHSPTKATCIMKKSSSTIDFMITSNELNNRCSTPQVQLNKHIATHRPVLMSLAISDDHKEPRLVESQRLPALPRSPTGPYNKPAKWDRAATAVHKAIEAAYVAAATSSKNAVRQAQRLHDKAFVMMVNSAEAELASKCDTPITSPGRRARAARIVWVKA